MVWPFGSSPGSASSETPPTSKNLTRQQREQQADAELDEFLRSLEGPSKTEPKIAVAPLPAVGGVAPPTNNVEKEHKTSPDERRVYEDGTIDITPELMHPRSMNCQQAFDQAFYCQSLGGKFNDIYRYGHFQSCSEQWSAFWFCMRVRTLGGEEKGRQTAEYYAKRDAQRRKEHGSSEDVWDVRTRSVQRAFWKDPGSILDKQNEGE